MIFSSGKSIKIDKELFTKLETAAQRAGYSSTDELIRHVLEREVAAIDEGYEKQEVEKQLRGLGYIE